MTPKQKILIGLFIFCLLIISLVIYYFKKSNPPYTTGGTTGTTGGTTGGPTGGQTGGPTGGPTGTTGGTSNQPVQDNVKYIELKQSANINSQAIHIAELKAYDNNDKLLLPSDYKLAEFIPPGGWGQDQYPANLCIDGDENNFCHSTYGNIDKSILFTLKDLKFIKKVIVINRKDFGQSRLAGVKLNLYDTDMKLIKSYTLTGDPTTICTW
jgi:hypothetical protein